MVLHCEMSALRKNLDLALANADALDEFAIAAMICTIIATLDRRSEIGEPHSPA